MLMYEDFLELLHRFSRSHGYEKWFTLEEFMKFALEHGNLSISTYLKYFRRALRQGIVAIRKEEVGWCYFKIYKNKYRVNKRALEFAKASAKIARWWWENG